MIPFLLHSRASGGGPPGTTLINPPGFAGQTYEGLDYEVGVAASETVSITIKADGTWLVVADTGSGSLSGNWISSPSAGVGSGYEVRMTVTGTTGAGTVSNPATSFVSLSVDRTFSLTVSRPNAGVLSGTRITLIEIQPSGGPVGSSGSVTLQATAEVGS